MSPDQRRAETSGDSDSQDMQLQLGLISDEVAALQIQLAKPQAPWFKRPANILSLIAVVFSIISAIYLQVIRHSEDIRSKKEELRNTMMSIIELRQEYETMSAQGADPEKAMFDWNTFLAKRAMLVEAAEFLLAQIPEHVSSSEYTALSVELVYDSNLQGGERLALRAVQAAETDFTKVFALRRLALLHFDHNELRDLEAGREFFQKAVNVLQAATDDYSLFTVGKTFERWGFAELKSGFETDGEQKLDCARKYYGDMSEANPRGPLALQELEVELASTSRRE